MGLATFAEKVRGMFDELDTTRSHCIGLDAWSGAFARFHFEFGDAKVRELFDIADANRDGVISFAEFQRFGELYPTLLDSLYFRCKDYWTDIHQLEHIDMCKRQLESVRNREETSRNRYAQAQQDTKTYDKALAMQIKVVEDAKLDEVEAHRSYQDARRATEMAREEITACAADQAAAQDADRENQVYISAKQRDVELAMTDLQTSQMELGVAEGRMREIEEALAQQRAEVARRQQAVQACEVQLATASDTVKAAELRMKEGLDTLRIVSDRMALAETALQARVMKERELCKALNRAAAAVAKELSKKDAAQRELVGAKDREHDCKLAFEADQAASRDQERMVEELEAQNADFNLQRLTVEKEEAPLLEQEVQLRDQRSQLEGREAKLRVEAQSFLSTARSQSPTYSPLKSTMRHSITSASPRNHDDSLYTALSPGSPGKPSLATRLRSVSPSRVRCVF